MSMGEPRRRPPAGGAPQQPPAAKYPLPQQTVRALLAWKDKAPQNPGLLFERYALDTAGEKQAAAAKGESLELVRAAAKRIDTKALDALRQRWRADARALGAEPFELQTDWRLIAGLGRKGPLEVGFTFHRYGFPILPGSSLKGLARARAFYAVCDLLGKEGLAAIRREIKETALQALDRVLALPKEESFLQAFPPESEALAAAERLRRIFGTTAAAGLAVFLDAIPAGVPELQLDIMNPHYPQYYQGTEPPTDWQSPVPVTFLAVAPGTPFLFAVGWRRTLGGDDAGLQEQARQWLIEGLVELGAGAKTGAGYGYFVAPKAEPKPAATAAARPAEPPPAPELPVVQRQGTLVDIITNRREGRVRDDESGKVYNFELRLFGGETPGKKARVVFALQGDKVVSIRKA
ncbi:MAG: type III-B CRISPR module RAMP protein Cmr6 [Anaerolineae bacterium]